MFQVFTEVLVKWWRFVAMLSILTAQCLRIPTLILMTTVSMVTALPWQPQRTLAARGRGREARGHPGCPPRDCSTTTSPHSSSARRAQTWRNYSLLLPGYAFVLTLGPTLCLLMAILGHYSVWYKYDVVLSKGNFETWVWQLSIMILNVLMATLGDYISNINMIWYILMAIRALPMSAIIYHHCNCQGTFSWQIWTISMYALNMVAKTNVMSFGRKRMSVFVQV